MIGAVVFTIAFILVIIYFYLKDVYMDIKGVDLIVLIISAPVIGMFLSAIFLIAIPIAFICGIGFVIDKILKK
jgi:hypothetical protein